jgi:hypothetical protein
VHQEDFDGRFRGMWIPSDYEGEIEVDGLVLMARPKTWSDKARAIDTARAFESVDWPSGYSRLTQSVGSSTCASRSRELLVSFVTVVPFVMPFRPLSE